MTYNTLISIHIISVILLLGVGAGSAFYKFMSDRSGNLEVIVHTNKMVVLADWLFTTPSVILQPITGVMLVNTIGYSFNDFWLIMSVNLYVLAVFLWLVAVFLQVRMKNLSVTAQKENNSLGKDYSRLVNYWIVLGFFSFFFMAWIFYLMVFKI